MGASFCWFLVVVLAIHCAPSEQKRKPDRNQYVLEISEAGEVKQIPVIQPALDAISGLWTSLAGSDRPSKSSVATVKPTKVVPVAVKPTAAGQKPSKVKHKATTSGVVGTTKIVPPQSTPKKVAVRSSSVASVVTVTPKMVPVSSSEATTTTTTTTTTAATTVPTTTQVTTTSSTGRALEDESAKRVVPVEFFLRLQQLLLKIRQYNKEIAIPVFAMN